MAEKILVADDSLTIQKVVAITLANEPWTLVEATDETELFSKLRSGDYKLVLLDFNLSESKSGYDLAKEIKAIAPTASVFAMLGTFDSVDESSLLEAGIDDKIVKPFDSQKFIHKCRDLVSMGPGNFLSSEEKEGLSFVETEDEEIQAGDEVNDWVMDAPQKEDPEEDFFTSETTDEEHDSWDEETSPGISAPSELHNELEDWGVSVPGPIGAKDDVAENPPVISAADESDDEPLEELEEKFSEPIPIQVSSVSEESEDSLYPQEDDLNYPDIETSIADMEEGKLTHNAISLDQLADDEDEDEDNEIEFEEDDQDDDDVLLSLRSKPEAPREELAREIESELSADDFWAVDDEDSDSSTRESFVVGVGDPQAPVEPVRPSQKSSLEVAPASQLSELNEDRIVARLKESLAPMLEEIVRRYMDEKVEKVAWEIIPDVAENLIRKEIKAIAQASKDS